jgi:ATP-dependent helicase/nuclease subunit A
VIERDDATARQVKAADPKASTWVAANAGSGKTRVLTDRVARLLLDQVAPQSILCLTYTKAAASEMQNRLFKRLGAWAMMDDAPLIAELEQLGATSVLDSETLARARRLFARAIETPGGLKIQTIHAFCATLLRRFPLEAGVSPGFTEMDDRAAKNLQLEVLDRVATEAPHAYHACAAYISDPSLQPLAAEISKNSDCFRKDPDFSNVLKRFSLPSETSLNSILSSVFLGAEQELFTSLATHLNNSTKTTDHGLAEKLAKIRSFDVGSLTVLEGMFLTGEKTKSPFSAKIGTLPTKDCRNVMPPDMLTDLESLMLRIEAARGDRLAFAAAEKTFAVEKFAAEFLPRYQRQKSVLGQLDFDDLIVKARNLLSKSGMAQWVLFKLDGGIDHILVDEAQDTSPTQWDVIELLTGDFATGESARSDAERTIFVVGDKKQSIYSFQGADPAGFDRMASAFGERLAAVGETLQELELEYSFRSSRAILETVDKVFATADPSLSKSHHRAFHQNLPGRVDLWPAVERPEETTTDSWENPVDMVGETHHFRQLATSIASEIVRIKENEVLWTGESGTFAPRAISEGDVLILVQRRSALFHEIIRACKEAGLEVAGADLLKLAGELAVKDITALLSFLVTPEDDLSLATVLRSPIFGWSETDLFQLAHNRPGYLWQALRGRACSETETLQDLLNQADFLRPYDLINRLLLRHDGRRKLLARLGAEAEDGIDAILSQSLSFEQKEPPSLTGFLSWLESGETEIKRQAESAGRKLRVMTVHGAKGLEAPIVILPDTADRPDRIRGQILPLGDDTAVWATSAAESPPEIASARAAELLRQEEENRRLLYVAMTRAESWLIVCAAGQVKEGKGSWHDQVGQALSEMDTAAVMLQSGDVGVRYAPIEWPNAIAAPITEMTKPAEALPSWIANHVSPPTRPEKPLTPSDLGGTKSLPREDADPSLSEASRQFGIQLHALLEHLPNLPRDTWDTAARYLLTDKTNNPAEIDTVIQQAFTVLNTPELQLVFDVGTLAEVPVTAHLAGMGRPIYGIIDRLIVQPDRILIVDFKSNALTPDTPDDVPSGILRQMGAYADAVSQIYPDHEIQTAILWTQTATLMNLPHVLVSEALQNTTLP